MKCPYCKSEMKEGTAQVRGSFTTFLIVGFSIQDLMFDSPDETTTITSSGEQRQAYYCDKCKGAFIQGSDISEDNKIDPIIGIV